MATILIREVPEAVHAALKQQAAKSRRSKEKEALCLIETGLRRRRPAAEIIAQARKLQDRCKGTATMKEILKLTEQPH